jgi:hypothetical protein
VESRREKAINVKERQLGMWKGESRERKYDQSIL